MKSLLTALAIVISAQAFASDGYRVIQSRWGNEVELIGVTGDLFATHELLASRGPGWKKTAEAYIENKTDAIEISGKIEDGTVTESCGLDFEDVDYIEVDSLSYKWKALKSVRNRNAGTILYSVSTYGNYSVNLSRGKAVKCPYLISEYVFLNKASAGKPFKYLGTLSR